MDNQAVETPASGRSERRRKLALRICELLLVVITVGLLLLPVLEKNSAIIDRMPLSSVQMAQLRLAIEMYLIDYERIPTSKIAPWSGIEDFTFGTFQTSASGNGITNASGSQANNSEVMAILLNWTNFPNGRATANVGHAQNPEQREYLSSKVVEHTNSPGLGSDGVFRDPWGNPYIIVIDSNGDGNVLMLCMAMWPGGLLFGRSVQTERPTEHRKQMWV